MKSIPIQWGFGFMLYFKYERDVIVNIVRLGAAGGFCIPYPFVTDDRRDPTLMPRQGAERASKPAKSRLRYDSTSTIEDLFSASS
jgi:hypothetical protein